MKTARSRHASYRLLPRKTEVTITVEEVAALSDSPSAKEIRSVAAKGALKELEDKVNDAQDSWETESFLGDVIEELSGEAKLVSDGKFPVAQFYPSRPGPSA